MRQTLLVAVLLSLSSCLAFGQNQTVELNDKSDWWSLLRTPSHNAQLQPAKGELDVSSFIIAGVSLTSSPFTSAIEKLGYAQKVKRGDGPTARRQLCYESKGKPPSFLVFESAEVSEGFYLFSSKKDWHGRKRCTDTSSTQAWKTDSGLRLGLSPAQVQTILGKPDDAHDNRVLYLRQFKQNNLDVTLYIEARFADSRLNYLAVSRAETN
jgi:hypothetical protein